MVAGLHHDSAKLIREVSTLALPSWLMLGRSINMVAKAFVLLQSVTFPGVGVPPPAWYKASGGYCGLSTHLSLRTDFSLLIPAHQIPFTFHFAGTQVSLSECFIHFGCYSSLFF